MKYFFSIAISTLLLSVSFAQQNVEQVDAGSFKKTMDSLAARQIIDVRTPQEFATGYIPGAININFYDKDFKTQLESLDKNQPVFVYCKVGGRSAQAAKQLEASGFKKIYDLDGGILSWTRTGLQVDGATATPNDNKFTKPDYDKLLSDNKALLIDFYAPWCIPCKQMEPSLKKLSAKYAGKVHIARINIDEAKELTKQLNVDAIPVLTVYKDGKEIKRVIGLQSATDLEKLVKIAMK